MAVAGRAHRGRCQKILLSYHFDEIVSTRRLGSRASDKHYVDIKVGNLMVQRVTRCETTKARCARSRASAARSDATNGSGAQGLEITTLITLYIQKHMLEHGPGAPL